jgi:hypothetical protein
LRISRSTIRGNLQKEEEGRREQDFGIVAEELELLEQEQKGPYLRKTNEIENCKGTGRKFLGLEVLGDN